MTDLKEVARFLDPEEAVCAISYLRAQGVNASFHNAHHLTMAPWLRFALGGYSIWCPEDEVEFAARELAAVNDNSETTELVSDAEDTNRDSLSGQHKKNFLWLPIAFFSGVPFVLRYRSKTTLFWQVVLVLLFLVGFGWAGLFNWLV